jgi:hypothetical protein
MCVTRCGAGGLAIRHKVTCAVDGVYNGRFVGTDHHCTQDTLRSARLSLCLSLVLILIEQTCENRYHGKERAAMFRTAQCRLG